MNDIKFVCERCFNIDNHWMIHRICGICSITLELEHEWTNSIDHAFVFDNFPNTVEQMIYLWKTNPKLFERIVDDKIAAMKNKLIDYLNITREVVLDDKSN